jgi:flagellin-like hook-associated protein FlgL
VDDASYRGVNLLKDDNLETVFNEGRTNKLTTEGVNFTSNGLGLSEADFSNEMAVQVSLDQLLSATGAVRDFGSSIANDLSIIQNRQDFTEKTIETLEEGSDKLTLADPNEEGAKLLSLQTRQQLSITSLALASQSQSAVLSLF